MVVWAAGTTTTTAAAATTTNHNIRCIPPPSPSPPLPPTTTTTHTAALYQLSRYWTLSTFAHTPDIETWTGPGKFLASGILIANLILLAAYSANLTANLSSRKVNPPSMCKDLALAPPRLLHPAPAPTPPFPPRILRQWSGRARREPRR